MQEIGAWAILRAFLGHGVQIMALTSAEEKRTLEIALAVGVAGLHHADIETETLRSPSIEFCQEKSTSTAV